MTAPTTLPDTIRALLTTLAAQRADLAEVTATLAERKRRYEVSIAGLSEQKAALAQQVTQLEEEIGALAIAAFETDPAKNKTPVEGVQIKEFEVLTYNGEQALAWAVEKGLATLPVRLDTKAFEAIAKSTDISFVTKTKEPRAMIAKDLSAYAPPAEAVEPEAPEPAPF